MQSGGEFERAMLAGDLRRELDAGAVSNADAARRLAIREPWMSFLTAGRWRDARSRDIGAPLLQASKTLVERDEKMGEAAYQFCASVSDLTKWDDLVRLINQTSSARSEK